jgi:CheY-like chemotaxis protein
MTDHQKSLRVLIIDDDPTTLKLFKHVLQAEYHVRAVPTVQAGLAEATSDPRPDAVLLDLRLPLIDGLECLRRLRAAPSTAALPVAIVTGDYFMDATVSDELKSLGARIYFKPVWLEDLHRIVAELVREQPNSAH